VGKDLDQYAEDRAQAQFSENQEIARKLRAVTAELGEVTAERNRLAESNEALQRVYDATLTLTPEPDWLKPRKRTKAERGTLVPFLSDLHAGELVRPEEMGGSNAYNLRIADQRLQRFFDNTIYLARHYFTGMEYDGIVLPLGGDLISGAIHDELRDTDELSVLDSTLWVAPRLVAGLEKWAEEFGSVHVVSVPGNHGRDHKTPRYKGRSAHNADTHIARMVALFWALKNTTSAVTFDIPESYDAQFSIYSTRFTLEHGEEFQKNNPGTAEIGMLGPAKRGQLRKSRALSSLGQPFDVALLAHFHQLVYAPHQGFIANGSVKGYDEYAKGLSLKPEPAQQALFIVDPDHGPTLHAPIRLTDRKAEGW
jgi:hypothetical protein